jgi:hypothetical protein
MDTESTGLPLVRVFYEDGRGNKHRRYSVRSLGPHRGFGLVDVLKNLWISPTAQPYATREAAWQALARMTDDED